MYMPLIDTKNTLVADLIFCGLIFPKKSKTLEKNQVSGCTIVALTKPYYEAMDVNVNPCSERKTRQSVFTQTEIPALRGNFHWRPCIHTHQQDIY